MIELEVIAAEGVAPNPPLRVVLDPAGGTIGRAPGNALTLPDPQRSVSRVHAQILHRQGVTVIVSRSPNGLVASGAHVDFGDEVPLADDALIEMGSYVIRFTHRRVADAGSPG